MKTYYYYYYTPLDTIGESVIQIPYITSRTLDEFDMQLERLISTATVHLPFALRPSGATFVNVGQNNFD